MTLARAVAVAAGAIWLAGGLAIADGGNERTSACYSYREAKAKWPGAYLTWRYDSRKWQCWAPRGSNTRQLAPEGQTKNRNSTNAQIVEKNRLRQDWARLGKPGQTWARPLQGAEDVSPDFPQPSDVRIEQPPWPHPGGLGWVWESREPFEPRRMGDDPAPVPVYSTFDGEPPDVWPQMKPAGAVGLPAVGLLLAFLAGGMFLVLAAVVGEGYSARSLPVGRPMRWVRTGVLSVWLQRYWRDRSAL